MIPEYIISQIRWIDEIILITKNGESKQGNMKLSVGGQYSEQGSNNDGRNKM